MDVENLYGPGEKLYCSTSSPEGAMAPLRLFSIVKGSGLPKDTRSKQVKANGIGPRNGV